MQFLKKIMTILFSCVILGSMTACGGGADSSKDSASENTPTASGMFNPTLTVDQKDNFFRYLRPFLCQNCGGRRRNFNCYG